MSTTTGTARAKGIQKRLIAQEIMEVVTVAADTTLSELHVDALLNINSGAGKTLTLPADADNLKIKVGHSGLIMQGGAGAITISAGAGATLNAQFAGLAGANRVCRWLKTAVNTYVVFGNAVS